MPTTNARSASLRQRNPLEFSLSLAERQRRDALLRGPWMQIVGGFDCRPSPRSAWDRAADGTERRWNKIVDPMRQAVATAVVMGDQELIDQTMEAVRGFLRAIEADIASFIPPRQEESVTELALLETECAGESSVEAVRIVAHPSPVEAERAIQVLSKQQDVVARFIAWCQRAARQPSMRMAR